jgi:YfiR/HmsC-like
MRNKNVSRAGSLFGRTIAFMASFTLLFQANRGFSGDASLTEYQVKSLILVSLPKYVDWPSNAFANANAPIVIGVLGDSKFGAELAKTVEGQNVVGRPVIVRQFQTPEDSDKCHILFIGSSEKTHLVDILGRIKEKPVLTVGETDQFLDQGGVINFVKKEGKVRLEINMDAARLANLQISSRLLRVADVVKGKSK